MKKYIFIILLIVVSAITSYFYLIKSNENNPKHSSIDLNIPKENLEKRIKEELQKANYCKVPEDCKVVGYGCPFNCYNFVNAKYPLANIEKAVKHYNKDGLECVYDCDRAPKMEEIDCINNKCVDKRFLAK